MTPDVCVPWRPDEAERSRNWALLRSQWEMLGWPIHEGNHPAGAAASRNAAIEKGTSEIIVVTDADVLIPLPQVLDAVGLAHRTGGYVVAQSSLYWLDDLMTRRAIAGERIESERYPADRNTWFNVFALPRDLWARVGGFDERFGEWGRFEGAFWQACRTIASCHRVQGPAWHLWHPLRELVVGPGAEDLAWAYRRADGDPEAMTALLPPPRTRTLSV